MNEQEFQQALAEMAKEPEPEDYIAAFDPGSWTLAKAMLKTLIAKGVIAPADLVDLHQSILSDRDQLIADRVVQHAASVENVADWVSDRAAEYGVSIDRIKPKEPGE